MGQPDQYFRRLNKPLLGFLPAGLGSVLDVGCATGALGHAYKEAHPGSRWTGIELDGGAAGEAAKALDHVIVGDAEFVVDTPPGAPFDALIYADSLEHLRDPAATLRRHLGWLKPGGAVLACIPNIQHWSAILSLLAGRWDYRDQGLFDRTHLRFFTLSTIVGLFEAAGCTVERAEPLIPRPGLPLVPGWERHEALMAEVRRACESLGLAFDARRFLAYQYLVQARSGTDAPGTAA